MISKELFDRCVAFIGLQLPNGAFDLFDRYAKLLTKYNEKVNLTAVTDPDGIVIKHFADSLCLLVQVELPRNAAVCDVGTGAGFPGMCLKLARSDLNVTLMDSVNKKLEFLRFLSKELSAQAEIVHIRAEDAGKDARYREKFDLCTARAVSQLNKLSEYCIPLVKVGGMFAPLKAQTAEDERAPGLSAAKRLGATLKREAVYSLITGEQRRIFIFEKISQTSPKFPRSAALIAKSPLN